MKNIIIAYDFSDASENALKHAVDMAQAHKACLWILHVADPEPDFVTFKTGPEVVRKQVANEYRNEHKLIQKITDNIKLRHENTKALLIQGPVVESILAQAGKIDADMIVIGARSQGKLEEFISGSVSKEILKNSNVPVLVCK